MGYIGLAVQGGSAQGTSLPSMTAIFKILSLKFCHLLPFSTLLNTFVAVFNPRYRETGLNLVR